MSLSYDKLARISKGMEVDIGVLFAPGAVSPSPVSGRRSITRAGEGRAIRTETYNHLYPATELLNKRFVPIVAEIRARSLAEFGEMLRHPGEEYAYVLEGCVELHTDLYAPVLLEQGDSIYFDSGMGHAYVAVGPAPCRVIAICSGAESQLIAALEKTMTATQARATKPDTTRTDAVSLCAPAPLRKAARRRAGNS